MSKIRKITVKQKTAFEILWESPLSTKLLWDLSNFIVNGPSGSKAKNFKATREFLRKRHLSQTKTLLWLINNGIYCDYDFVEKVFVPMVERMEEYNKMRERELPKKRMTAQSRVSANIPGKPPLVSQNQNRENSADAERKPQAASAVSLGAPGVDDDGGTLAHRLDILRRYPMIRPAFQIIESKEEENEQHEEDEGYRDECWEPDHETSEEVYE